MYSAGDFNGLRACVTFVTKKQISIPNSNWHYVCVKKYYTLYCSSCKEDSERQTRSANDECDGATIQRREFRGKNIISLIKCVFIGIVECSE